MTFKRSQLFSPTLVLVGQLVKLEEAFPWNSTTKFQSLSWVEEVPTAGLATISAICFSYFDKSYSLYAGQINCTCEEQFIILAPL